jgi:cytochrome P450
MDIIGRTAFGHDFLCCKSLRSSPVAEAFEYLLDDFTQRSFNSILHPAHLFYWLPTARNRLHAKNFRIVRDAIGDILSKRKELRALDRSLEHHDILKYMLDAFEEQNIAADAETLSDNLVTMLFAGYDTSSITLTYAFYLMARHPDVAIRCRQEVVAAIGATAHASFNDVQTQLPLCTAVINETLRLYPPAPVTVRYTEKSVELMPGVVVPPGSTLYLPIWWIHRSPHNFDEPDVFRPERFLGGERERKHHRYSFIPFSGGARDCVGRRFAMTEAVAVFAHVIRNVDFEVRCDHEVHVQAVGPVQKPKGGMPLRVRVVNMQN